MRKEYDGWGSINVPLPIFQLSQDNHWYICSVNDGINGGENDGVRPPTAVEGN